MRLSTRFRALISLFVGVQAVRLRALGAATLAILLCPGCTTTRVDGEARAEPSQRIQVLALIYDNTTKMVPDSWSRMSPYAATGEQKAAETEYKLTSLLERRFPPVFAAEGVELQVYWRSNASFKMEPDPRRRHVLYLKPIRASFSGAGAGVLKYEMAAQLDELAPQRTLWTGTVSLMRHQFADLDEKAVDEFAAKIIAELKSDHILGVAGNPLAVVPPKPVAPVGRTVYDVDAVPLLNERGRQGYRDWLSKKAPRAFVIAQDGSWNSTWGTTTRNPDDPKDPAERALANCKKRGLKDCRLYAVDDRVVWDSP